MSVKRHITVTRVELLCVLLLCWVCSAIAVEPNVGVLSPDVREPFRTIFRTIEQGVEENLPGKVKRYSLRDNFSASDLDRWVRKQNIGSVVALGVLGQEAAAALPQDRTVVLGALLNAPNDMPRYPGIALTPDPVALFDVLQELKPGISRVSVVYNPGKNQWLVDWAKIAAAQRNITLALRHARDLKESAMEHKYVLEHSDFDKEAIWLLQDSSVVDSKAVLPFILQQAWSRNATVFSSSLAHVKKGVLFSLYPDNKMHGAQIAKLLLDEVRNSNGKKIYASTGLLRAINSRTAEHLGLRLTGTDLSAYDVVFPISN